MNAEIRSRWSDRAFRLDYQRSWSKRRREANRAKGVCINSEKHGPATHGVLCRACRATHRGVAIDDVEGVADPRSWKCYARPASTGTTCGHVNATGGIRFRGMTCCAQCGCTKKASDDRQKGNTQ